MTSPADPPFDLAGTGAILGPDGTVTTREITPDFYATLDRDFGGFTGCTLLSRHEFAEPWPVWEMHPAGDEIVYLLSGDVDFLLRTADGDTTVRVHEPGSYIVVPRGVWHTARPNAPTTMLFLTPGEGTQHAETPPTGA